MAVEPLDHGRHNHSVRSHCERARSIRNNHALGARSLIFRAIMARAASFPSALESIAELWARLRRASMNGRFDIKYVRRHGGRNDQECTVGIA